MYNDIYIGSGLYTDLLQITYLSLEYLVKPSAFIVKYLVVLWNPEKEKDPKTPSTEKLK